MKLIPRSRRGRVVAVAVAVPTAMAVGFGIAWALFSDTAEFRGGGVIETPTNVVIESAAVTAENMRGDCTASTTADGAATLNFTGLPGESCTVQFEVMRTGIDPGSPIFTSAVSFATNVTETFVNNALGQASCGAPINGTPRLVNVTFTLGDTPGPITPESGAGILVSDTPGAC